MQDISGSILKVLARSSNLKAKELASLIGQDKKLINHCLYTELKNQVVQNSDYSWQLNVGSSQSIDAKVSAASTETPSTGSITQEEQAAQSNHLEQSVNMDQATQSDQTSVNDNFAFDSLEAIRNRLLDLTGRNRLLNFKHGKSGFIRVIDEMPDQLAQQILEGKEFTFLPIEEPRSEELIEHGYIGTDEDSSEVKIKPAPKAPEWAKIKGFNTNYELPLTVNSDDDKHNDTNIQSLLYPRELEAQLRSIRSKANTAIEETGANILYLAFGFLEWFEDENSDVIRQAPLYLIPVKIDRASLNKDSGTYTYNIEYTGEDIISNLSLREKLRHDFHLELPEIVDDIYPEAYFEIIERLFLRHKPEWKVKRFATLAMFDFGKLLMYLDLDPSRWPKGEKNIQNHAILQKFFAQQGTEENGEVGSSFSKEYPIDELDDVHTQFPLIDDADSSQHSALVDVIQGKNLVIEGPPGSGKSQTITNLIAAAISQGKKVLFVAEKMAALDVVKSRLKRAGLGDFCLELHSHKTKKKQVYDNILHRINKQDEYRYPSSIDIDIQMYEEKKATLSDYADLINSNWKNTNRTIHQIFTTATRYREEFADIELNDIQPEHINGHSFDEIASRRTTDELKKYADVFEQVKTQLGSKAKLSDHPWFGVYNKDLQLFDSDDVCKLLEEWNKSLHALTESLKPLNELLQPLLIDNEESLLEIYEDVKDLPLLQGHEYYPALKNFTPEHRIALTKYIQQYEEGRVLFCDLKNNFEIAALSKGEILDKLLASGQDLQNICVSHDMKLSNIYTHTQLLSSLGTLTSSLSDDLGTIKSHENSISEVIPVTVNGFTDLHKYLSLIANLDLTLISRRNALFDNDILDQYIFDLEKVIKEIQPLHKKLADYFHLDDLPSVIELRDVRRILDKTGLFSWLSSEWRITKSKLFSYAKSSTPDFKYLTNQLSDLVTYQELRQELEGEAMYSSLLKDEFRGIDTPIHEIITIRQWYKDIREYFGVGFGKKVAFATSLFNVDSEIFRGLQHLATSKTLTDLEQFSQLNEQLALVFKHKILFEKDTDLDGDFTFLSLADQLTEQLKSIQSVTKNDHTLHALEFESSKINKFLETEQELNTNQIVTKLFEEHVGIDVRNHSDDDLLAVQSTLDLYSKINKLKCKQLKDYLILNIDTDTLDTLKAKIANSNSMYNEQERALEQFAVKVELDKSAWFKDTNENFELYITRNIKALSQPRWLSTWVDFIRIRASLSDKGLENLLRYTETGSISLENIEPIYMYSVFDILAREIISEKQELAYFSGADHNAIRKQFREYDNKLKTLQQEKIAHRVAHTGFNNLSAGVSSGKVANYSHMGLINHETNKKTRHLSIRQLVKRAGTTLAELKPCFMMGPHSVAQYLEPGLIEFDIIVMDEASQIKPEDALGTIARGKQLVVVGDPKQLPPTSFFDKTIETEEEDVTAIEQSESILDVSLPMFSARRLRWHYRSRHESLIAFSNQQFYDSNLVVFPSPESKSDEFGIKFTHVKSGRFVNQHNIEEAKVIATSVRNHLLNRPSETLGVVAMSAKQREQIERCVEELSKDDTQFRDALSANSELDEPLFLKNLENVQGDERDVIFISCTYGPQEAGAAQMPQRFGPINSAAGGRRLNVLFTRSKKRMHVFSSMTEGHILASATSNPGVHALKSFLAYAQSGNLHQAQHTGKAPDSDFEISVMNALKLEGFNCVPQVGVAGYYIDLAVQDPGQPGRYLMGIECDGATYHSAKSARDRDRLRQTVLEGLGWNINRIWSTDWFKNPQAQLRPIIEMLHQLKTEVSRTPNIAPEVAQIQQTVELEEATHHTTDEFSQSNDSLADKLRKFGQTIMKQTSDEVPLANSLLRPAMVDALCEFKPISKSEFLEVIPSYLRTAISTKHAKYLEQVLNIIAEDEDETYE